MSIIASSEITLANIVDGYSVTLSSENCTFIEESDGVPIGSTCSTSVYAYCGNSPCNIIIVDVNSIECPDGIEARVSGSNTPSPVITFTTYDNITEYCEAIIPVEVNGITIDKKFSFSIAKKGESAMNCSYGTCDTSAGTQQKRVSLFGTYVDYEPEVGDMIAIKFTYGSTCAMPRLTVEGFTSIGLIIYNNKSTPLNITSQYTWDADCIKVFTYKQYTSTSYVWYISEPTEEIISEYRKFEAIHRNLEEAAKVANNFLQYDSNGLMIGDILGEKITNNLLLQSSKLSFRDGSAELASMSKNLIELGKNSTSSKINLSNSSGIFTGFTNSGMKGFKLSTATGISYLSLVDAEGVGSDVYLAQVYKKSTGQVSDQSYFRLIHGSAHMMSSEQHSYSSPSQLHTDLSGIQIYPRYMRLIFDSYCPNDGTSYNYPSDIYFMDNNVDSSSTACGLIPYYRNGVSFSIIWHGAGYITTGSTQVYFTIPLAKPIFRKTRTTFPTVTVSSNQGFLIRCNGKYVSDTSGNLFKPSKITAYISENNIVVVITLPNTTNAVNNTPCGVYANIDVTLT